MIRKYFRKNIKPKEIEIILPKISYEITYHKSLQKYVLWKICYSNKSAGCKGIFQGTRKECQEKLKEIKTL